jgi:hypothetical protein
MAVDSPDCRKATSIQDATLQFSEVVLDEMLNLRLVVDNLKARIDELSVAHDEVKTWREGFLKSSIDDLIDKNMLLQEQIGQCSNNLRISRCDTQDNGRRDGQVLATISEELSTWREDFIKSVQAECQELSPSRIQFESPEQCIKSSESAVEENVVDTLGKHMADMEMRWGDLESAVQVFMKEIRGTVENEVHERVAAIRGLEDQCNDTRTLLDTQEAQQTLEFESLRTALARLNEHVPNLQSNCDEDGMVSKRSVLFDFNQLRASVNESRDRIAVLEEHQVDVNELRVSIAESKTCIVSFETLDENVKAMQLAWSDALTELARDLNSLMGRLEEPMAAKLMQPPNVPAEVGHVAQLQTSNAVAADTQGPALVAASVARNSTDSQGAESRCPCLFDAAGTASSRSGRVTLDVNEAIERLNSFCPPQTVESRTLSPPSRSISNQQVCTQREPRATATRITQSLCVQPARSSSPIMVGRSGPARDPSHSRSESPPARILNTGLSQRTDSPPGRILNAGLPQRGSFGRSASPPLAVRQVSANSGLSMSAMPHCGPSSSHSLSYRNLMPKLAGGSVVLDRLPVCHNGTVTHR